MGLNTLNISGAAKRSHSSAPLIARRRPNDVSPGYPHNWQGFCRNFSGLEFVSDAQYGHQARHCFRVIEMFQAVWEYLEAEGCARNHRDEPQGATRENQPPTRHAKPRNPTPPRNRPVPPPPPSQFAQSAWHAKLGNGAIADAVIGRIVYKSHVTHIEGEGSMRKRMSGIK